MENKAKNETDMKAKTAKTAPAKAISIKELSLGRSEMHKIDPRKITIKEGFNARQDYGDIEELERSILDNGVRNPMHVFIEGNKLFLSDGHRRLTAVMNLIKKGHDIKSVNCLMEERGTSEEQLVARQMVYNDGKPLTPMEEAQLIQRLLNFGWTPQQIAKSTGRSQGHISNAKALLNLPQEVASEVNDNTISATFAVDLARQCGDDKEKLKKMVKEAKEKAAALGRKKVTKKIATEGTTKRTSRKEERAKLVDILRKAISAIRSEDDSEKADVIEELEEYIGVLVA